VTVNALEQLGLKVDLLGSLVLLVMVATVEVVDLLGSSVLLAMVATVEMVDLLASLVRLALGLAMVAKD
jgi:hypothetical protein